MAGSTRIDPNETAVRCMLEARERATLSDYAALSETARRDRDDPPSPVRTAFQRDRDRVIHTKSFRRLMHKTQVFIAPAGDHYRTRLTHTLEVTQLARTVARALRLNEDLVEAIGMAHDLGHTPFGHAGERALASVFPNFRHNEQSLRVVEVLEKNGEGLNLTDLVRDGILRHSKPRSGIEGSVSGEPSTLEGRIIKVVDSIAYMNHDLDDAIRAGILSIEDIPNTITDDLGTSHGARINTLILDLIGHSTLTAHVQSIHMSDARRLVANQLRDFLFERVYDPINQLERTRRAGEVVIDLFNEFCERPESIPDTIPAHADESIARRAADAVATMTDRYAMELHQRVSPHQTVVQ